MTPLQRRACALGLTLAVVVAAATATDTPTKTGGTRYVEGAATAADGHLIYTESHWLYDDGGNPSRVVLYRCPDGKPFARKQMHDDGNAQAPDFELDDARAGYREGVRRAGTGREVFMRTDKNASERTAVLETSPPPIIDAGFDAYIHHHWDTLGSSGEALPFLVPSRLGTLNFKIRRQPDVRIDGHDARLYRLSLDSVIGFALPHLDVAYDASTRQLLSFRGMANIRRSDGGNVDARIVFDPSKNRDGTRGDVEAAKNAPLDGRCSIP